jgi:hypothetical protein
MIAHWHEYSTGKRMLFIGIASLFHFSSIFVLVFVSLGSRATAVIRMGGALLVGVVILILASWSPDSLEAYSRLYVGGAQQSKLTAPGAIFQIAPLSFAALIYLLNRRAWISMKGDDPLRTNMAWGGLLLLPAILVSSVGAYRFALYFWPMAMGVYGDVPATIENATGRAFYRLCTVLASFALLIGWLQLGNNAYAWLPYHNWLLEPEGISMFRSGHR